MMAARWVALSIMLATVALIGVLIGAALWPRDPAAPNGGSSSLTLGPGAERLSGQAGPWAVSAEISRGPGDSLGIRLLVANSKGEPANPPAPPDLAVRMVDMGMGIQPVSLTQEETGRWRGAMRVPMAGRWELQIEVDGARIVLPFTYAPG